MFASGDRAPAAEWGSIWVPYARVVGGLQALEVRTEVAPEFLDLASCVSFINKAVVHNEEQSSLDVLHLGEVSKHHERHQL